MVPQTFLTFFAASLTADGALIGLLFVAISIAPGHTLGKEAELERELAANSAFSALVNAFLISMIALIPGITIGWAVVVIAAISMLNTIVHTADKLRRSQRMFQRSILYTIGGILVYGLEIYYSIQIIQQPLHSEEGLYGLMIVLVAVFGVALARAWTLLGDENRSLARILADIIRRRLSRAPATDVDSTEKKSVPSD
ncbi:MAG TPA: hypothetical protein VF040_12480 [Ktedonobacterales bacterium]